MNWEGWAIVLVSLIGVSALILEWIDPKVYGCAYCSAQAHTFNTTGAVV